MSSPAPATVSPITPGCRETNYWGSSSFHAIGRQIHHQSIYVVEDEVDPFLVVENELFILANRLRSIVVAEVPEYFFKKESDFNQQTNIYLLSRKKDFTKSPSARRLLSVATTALLSVTMRSSDTFFQSQERNVESTIAFFEPFILACLACSERLYFPFSRSKPAVSED